MRGKGRSGHIEEGEGVAKGGEDMESEIPI